MVLIHRLALSLLQYVLLSPVNYCDESTQCSNFKVSKLALWKKYTMSIKSCCNLKKSLFGLLNATAESVTCSPFLKNLEKHFCNLANKKLCQAH